YINFSDLKNETFILLHSGQGMRAIADNVFRFHNFSPHSIIQTTTVASTLSLVIGSYGFAFFGEKALKNVTFDTPLAYFSYDGIESMPINIAYLKGKKGCSIKGSMIDNFCECAKSILDNGLNAIER
ncbi:MAG TPA: LysR family transcriptional regulator substrate-binding protein, partial [Tissierellaceae bacterium]|nr:LysR family transcriptional regulator substrate-binding protein [Tissierellaceae bacterium]